MKLVSLVETEAWVLCVKIPLREGTSAEDYVMLDVAVLADPNLAARFPWDTPAKEDLTDNRRLRVVA